MREFRNGAGKPVVALDIDGSLGDYHAHFLDFATRWFGHGMPPAEKINPGLKLWEHMGVSQRDYRDAKLAYRQGGWKRWMPAYEGAADLTAAIRWAGAEVWLCTTRPFQRLDNIDPDTREWLRRNEIKYDYVLFGEDKYEELIRQVGLDRIVAVFDDLPHLCDQAFHLGIRNIYFKSQPYNVGLSASFYEVRDLTWLREELIVDIKTWLKQKEDGNGIVH